MLGVKIRIFKVKESFFLVSSNAKDTNMLVSFVLGDANFSPKPQRESVEYRLCWVLNTKFLHWACTFHIVCVNFICVGYIVSSEHGL